MHIFVRILSNDLRGGLGKCLRFVREEYTKDVRKHRKKSFATFETSRFVTTER